MNDRWKRGVEVFGVAVALMVAREIGDVYPWVDKAIDAAFTLGAGLILWGYIRGWGA